MNIVLSLGMIWRVRAKPTADKAVSHSKASHMTARGAEVLDLVAVGAVRTVPWLEDALPLGPLLDILDVIARAASFNPIDRYLARNVQ